MASVTLYDAATGAPLAAEGADPAPGAVELDESGGVLVFDTGRDAGWLRLVLENEGVVVAGAELADGDDLADLYRAVQGRVQRLGDRIEHPQDAPDHLNLVHYLAAPRPDPPDPAIRGHLVATDDAVGVGAPTAAEAAAVLAFFRERAPWKTLVVRAGGTPAPSDAADVAVTVDDGLDAVTYHGRDESWVDGDAHVDALPDEEVKALEGDVATGEEDRPVDDGAVSEGATAGGDGGTTTDASDAEAVADAVTGATESTGRGPPGADPTEREEPAEAKAQPGETGRAASESDPGPRRETRAGADAKVSAGTGAGASAGTGDGEDDDELATHYERELERTVKGLRRDLVAIADEVDAVTGTVAARQRLFAAALSGEALASRRLTAVPADDERLESRRRQARALTLLGLLVVGVGGGVQTGAADPLAALLSEQYVLDLAPLALPVRWVVVDAPALVAGSTLLGAAVASWIAPGSPRSQLGALGRRVRDQVTVVGSGTVPTEVRSRAATVDEDLDDLEATAERFARREGVALDFESYLAEELLTTPGLPAVELVDREERRRDRVVAVVTGMLVGGLGAGACLGGLAAVVLAAGATPGLVLEAFAALAVVAVVAAGGKAFVLAWRVGGRPAAAFVGGAIESLPDAVSGRRKAVGGGTAGGHDGDDGTPAAERPGTQRGTTAPAFEHGDRDRPVVRQRSNRNWRLLLSSLAFLVVLAVDVAIYRGPLSIPEAIPEVLALSLMLLVPVVLATLAAVYWAFDV